MPGTLEEDHKWLLETHFELVHMGVGGSEETPLEARREPVEMKMVEDASNDLQRAMGAC